MECHVITYNFIGNLFNVSDRVWRPQALNMVHSPTYQTGHMLVKYMHISDWLYCSLSYYYIILLILIFSGYVICLISFPNLVQHTLGNATFSIFLVVIFFQSKKNCCNFLKIIIANHSRMTVNTKMYNSCKVSYTHM